MVFHWNMPASALLKHGRLTLKGQEEGFVARVLRGHGQSCAGVARGVSKRQRYSEAYAK